MVYQFLFLTLAAALPVAPSFQTPSYLQTNSSTGYVTSDLSNYYGKWLMNISIGSQQKQFTPIADSGSPEAWLPDYDGWANASTSLVKLNQEYQTTYVNSAVQGYYAEDTIVLDNTSLEKFRFGVVDNPDAGANNVGVFGLSKKNDISYDTLPYALKTAGKIRLTVASVYYRHSANKGKLIFGGVDQAKVGSHWESHTSTGSLWDFPLTKMTIDGNDVYVDTNATTSNTFLVDTGTEVSFFPTKFLNQLAPLFNATRQDSGYYVMPCNQPPDRLFLITLGDLTYEIPFSTFIWQPSGSNQCYLGAGDSLIFNLNLLGTTVLSNLYVAFDYDNSEVKLAKLLDTDIETIVAW